MVLHQWCAFFQPVFAALLAAIVGQGSVMTGSGGCQCCGCLLSYAKSRFVSMLPIPLLAPICLAAVELGSKERMVAFCRAVQKCCPIGSYISPEPGAQQ
jgi:hypothetical protein